MRRRRSYSPPPRTPLDTAGFLCYTSARARGAAFGAAPASSADRVTRVCPHRPLIESWLPVAALGIESRRESAPIPGQFPKLKTLHVWWARRPHCRLPLHQQPRPALAKLVALEGQGGTAVSLVTERDGRVLDACEFGIVSGREIDFDPDKGTVAGGDGVSSWDGLAIDGEHIKAEAQSGRMGTQLYAVAIRTPQGRDFRAPTRTDLDAIAAAEAELAEQRPRWLGVGILPDEEIDTTSNYDRGHRLYGLYRWADMFTPRQLLVHATFVEESAKIVPEVRNAFDRDRADAVLALLGLMVAKGVNWTASGSTWDTSRDKMRSVFEKHNFSIKWTFTEFEGARELYPRCLSQIVDAYTGIAELLQPADGGTLLGGGAAGGVRVPGPVTVTHGNAGNLVGVADGSVELVCIDPPYYDNVMYAELSNFFYVWEKRTLGLVWPELFAGELTDKKNEAVANPARFADAGRSRMELANADYEAKMTAIFAECQRVLGDDGVLTVMFTHKRAEAWDTLGMALMEAGFTIETSWPVNTESEQSLHQAQKNAAASTIFLVCRKRLATTAEHPYFEDLKADVRAAARDALAPSPPPASRASTCCWPPTDPPWPSSPPAGRSTRRSPTPSPAARGCCGRRRPWTPPAPRSCGSSASASSAGRRSRTR